MGNYRGLFEGWEVALTKNLIGRLRSRWRSLERESFEDLLQECLFHWFGVRNQFDTARDASPRAFMAQVVRNKLTDLGREHASDRRKVNVIAASLDATIGDDEDGPTLLDVLADTGPDDAAAERERFGVDVRIDLEAALAGLSLAQQRLCRLLGEEGLSIKVAAERLRIPRGTLYEEIKRIRKVFADHGLGDYLAG